MELQMTAVRDRIEDLYATARDVNLGRSRATEPGWIARLRIGLGRGLIAIGTFVAGRQAQVAVRSLGR